MKLLETLGCLRESLGEIEGILGEEVFAIDGAEIAVEETGREVIDGGESVGMIASMIGEAGMMRTKKTFTL